MLIWLASYPRSGNTLARLVCAQSAGWDTRSIYNDAAFHGNGLDALVRQRPFSATDLDLYRHAPEPFICKTHERTAPPGKAIYIVREGMAVIWSYAHYIQHHEPGALDFGKVIDELIYGHDTVTTFRRWGDHVADWSQRADTVLVSFDLLRDDPVGTMARAMELCGVAWPAEAAEAVQSFEDLNAKWPWFFREGDDVVEFTANQLREFRERHENGRAVYEKVKAAGVCLAEDLK